MLEAQEIDLVDRTPQLGHELRGGQRLASGRARRTERLQCRKEDLERAQVLFVRAFEAHREARQVRIDLESSLFNVRLRQFDRVRREDRIDKIVRLVDDHHRIVEVERERVARVLLQQEIVRQRDELGLCKALACAKVGARMHRLAELYEVLDVAHVRLG